MLAAVTSRLRVALSGTPGVAWESLPVQVLNTPLTSPADEPTKNSTLLSGTLMLKFRPVFAGVCAFKATPDKIRNKINVNFLLIKPHILKSVQVRMHK